MSQETPPESQEPTPESVPEMSPEKFQEMIEQIPVLKEMLQGWEVTLGILEKSEGDASEIELLKTKIAELREEITAREEQLEKMNKF